MRRLIGITFLGALVIFLLPAVLGGFALNTFGTIIVIILAILGLIFVL